MIYVGDQEGPLQVSGSIVGQRELREIVYSTKTQGPGEQYSEISPLVLGTFVIVVLLLCMVLFAFPWIILRKTIGTSTSKALLIMSWLTIAFAWLVGGYVLWTVIQLWQLGQPFAF